MPHSKNIPFPFIIDYLLPLEPRMKPFFGCYGLYIGEQIIFILREKDTHTDCNGIWIATSYEHHKSLKKEFPSLTSVSVLNEGSGETAWQMVPADSDDFEASAIKACELVLKGDKRIGKIPKPKKKKPRRT
jgi:hypothetical protein